MFFGLNRYELRKYLFFFLTAFWLISSTLGANNIFELSSGTSLVGKTAFHTLLFISFCFISVVPVFLLYQMFFVTKYYSTPNVFCTLILLCLLFMMAISVLVDFSIIKCFGLVLLIYLSICIKLNKLLFLH
jgi:hypothetical protein